MKSCLTFTVQAIRNITNFCAKIRTTFVHKSVKKFLHEFIHEQRIYARIHVRILHF